MRVQYPVVECLSRDRRVAGFSLSGGTVCEQSKEEGKGKESIQLSNTYDPGHGMVGEGAKKHEKIPYTREPRGQPFPNR